MTSTDVNEVISPNEETVSNEPFSDRDHERREPCRLRYMASSTANESGERYLHASSE